MQEFIAKHRDEITGVLSGFDRLVFRGTLRSLSHVNGMDTYLAMNKVLRKDFGRHVQQVSERLKQASLAEAVKRGRPVKYLTSPQADKEALARKIATQDGVRQGLIGVLTSVELCRSFEVYRNRETKQLDLVQRWRKCLFLYHYSIHPRWGFMHARIQTWFPFSIQVCSRCLRRRAKSAMKAFAALASRSPSVQHGTSLDSASIATQSHTSPADGFFASIFGVTVFSLQ